MAESDNKRIGDYVDEWRRLGDRFEQRYAHPVLLRREDDTGEDEDPTFHTAFMRRDMFDLAAPSSMPPDSVAPTAGDERRPSDRPRMHPVGEVLPIVKRPGAAFQERIGIGRARNADICILLPKVSKYHAFFSPTEDGRYTLTDAGSKNGTFVEGRKLEEKVAIAVENGCEVCVGPYRFTFYTPKGFASMVGRRAAMR